MWDPNCMLCAIIGECTFIFKSLSKIGFYHSGVLRWWLSVLISVIMQGDNWLCALASLAKVTWARSHNRIRVRGAVERCALNRVRRAPVYPTCAPRESSNTILTEDTIILACTRLRVRLTSTNTTTALHVFALLRVSGLSSYRSTVFLRSAH